MFTEYIKYYKKYREEYDKVAVLMQVGAFYEILGLNDVGNVYDIAGVLNINVTRSNKNIQEVSEVNPLMAGFPLVSLNKYLCCLVEHGYTVIVVDQTMLKGSKKQTRKVSGVYSSGVLPPDILDQSETVVMSVVCHGDEVSILCMYVSTNSLLLYTETVGTVGQLLDTLMEYIRVHGVSEVVVHNVEAKYETMLLDAIDIPVHVKGLETLYENVGYQETFLRKVYTHVDFGLLTPAEYFDLTHYPLALTNLVAAFTFIEAHNGKYLCNIAVPKMTIATDYLLLENNALEQLAIFGKGMRKNDSVMSVIDHTLTAIGKRSLRLLLSRPYKRYEDISRRLELCDIFDKAKGVIDDIRGELKGITDFTRVYRKVHLQVAGVSDIQQLHSCFKRVVEITCYLMCNIPQLERLGWIPCEQSFRDLLDYINTHVDLDSPWVFKRVEEINTLAGKLRDQYTIIDHEITKLDRYLEKANCIKLQETEGEIVLVCSKIRTELIKRGLVNDKRIAEYTIKANTSTCKITNDIVTRTATAIHDIKGALQLLVQQHLACFCAGLSERFGDTIKTAETFIGELDVVLSSVITKEKYNYTLPQLVRGDESMVKAKDLRHPIIERVADTLYTPVDITLDTQTQGMVLYAINATGKSSLLRSIGISVILAQCGMYVPASDFQICPFRILCTQVEMQDNLWKGHSSFVAEMAGLRRITGLADKRTLVLSDELTKGTEVVSATSIFASTILYLQNKQSKFLFTTHLTDIAKLPEIKSNNHISICHLSVKIEKSQVIFERKLLPGPCDELYGLEVARATGLDTDLLETAFKIRNDLLTKGERAKPKKSRYNAKKVCMECEICGFGQDIDTHHIHFQREADGAGFIKHFHKNNVGNLVALCKGCHDKVHHNKLCIYGYQQTLGGLQLMYKHID